MRGKEAACSVTGLVHRFAQDFDADSVISRMMQGRNWPRAQYMKDVNGHLEPMLPQEIKAHWKRNASAASAAGTWMHLQIECLLNGGEVLQQSEEMLLFRQYLPSAPRLYAYRTEWCVYSECDGLAGCIDFAGEAQDGTLVLIDWKRSKSLRSKYENCWQRMRRPLQHLDDCAGNHYRLQLNVYKYIVEKHYGWRVSAMYVVCLHPDNAVGGPFVDTVPDMASEVAAMMREHRVFLETAGGSSGERSSAESIVMSSSSGRAGVAPPDCFERAEQRLAAQRLNYTGGRLPQELVERLPGFFFSFEYLRTLACVSPEMCRSVRDREHWRNSRIFLNTDEFESTQALRRMVYFYSAARLCLVNVRQLAMFHVFPERMLLDWTASVARPAGLVRQGVSGFISDRPLMGCATFDLVLPDHAVGLYMGVQEWRGTKRSYCRIDNVFRQDCTVSFALDDMPPQPHGGRNRCQLLPGRTHRIRLRWDQRMLELSIDERGVSVARLRDGAADAVSPLARVFTWIHVRPRPFPQMASFRPVPSYVRLDPTIRCALCQREHTGLRMPRWAVCPLCDCWICVSHCGQTPWRLCPYCPNQLTDYIGGSHVQPYADATNFFQTVFTLEEEADKFSCVVRKTVRRHAKFLEQNPLAVKLLPDPAAKGSLSKRLWEKVMYRGRAIIDFLDQQKDLLLFRFLHALSEDLSSSDHKGLLDDLPHPKDMPDGTVWRQLALEYSLELQLQLAREQLDRSAAQAATEQRLRSEALQKHRSRASEPYSLSVPDETQACHSWEEVEGGSEGAIGPLAISQTSLDERIQLELDESVALALADNTQVSEVRVASGQLDPESAQAAKPETADQHELQDLQSLTKRRRLTPAAMKTSSAFDDMFGELSAATAGAFPEIPPHQPAPRQRTVLQHTAYLLGFVKERQPTWSDMLVRAAAAGLTVYRTRYQDLFVRDYVALLWIMEGERYLRSHNSTCYLYHEHGAFEAFRGIPPESTFARVKPFLLTLEGMFRILSPSTGRSDVAVLNGIAQTLQQYNHEAEYFDACQDAALYPPERPGRAAATRSRQQEDEAPNPADGWPGVVANMISKIAGPLQRDLLDERRLLQFVVEWCETPSSRQAGVAFADACLLYDRSPDEICTFVDPSPSNNIYIRIPHALRDPVLRVAQERFELFVRQTFWCNEDFFGCCLAAQALAKRGENVDRCFIGESAGGTGQSLYSSHLAAVYKHNHAFIDPNLWHNEDELRKQIESFATSFIITAQEKPESNKTFREDLYKKMISADDLAGRKPYGYVTRMLRITGWKRIETNALMTFKGVAESNFNSVLRRSLVWNPQSVFMDKEFLDKSYPDAAPDGIFPKDPCLREFLESGPAIAASLHQQLGFERRHSRDVCRKMIEAYAASGCTERKMRNACGLLPQTEKAAPAELKQAAASVAPPQGTDKSTPSSADDVLQGYLDKLGSFMLSDAGRQTKITSLWWKRFAPAT
ncbi:unnamed protein product [Symbiodinium sp. CCMP2592]|nr:unnamed protein product [Symbiodinium sp. CCMP2592]